MLACLSILFYLSYLNLNVFLVIVVPNMSNLNQNGVCRNCMSSHSSASHCDNFNQCVSHVKLLRSKSLLQKQKFDVDSSNYIFPSSRFKNELFSSQQMLSTKMKSNEGTLCNMTYIYFKFVTWFKQRWRTKLLIQYETIIRVMCF